MILNGWRLITMNSLMRMRSICKNHLVVLPSTKVQQYQTSSKRADRRITVEEDNEPLKYFGSEAAKWPARYTLRGEEDDMPPCQPAVVITSIAVFLIYFCILREENDIDRKLSGNLFDQVEGLEEVQLAISYKYNKERGMDTKDIEHRLQQLGTSIDEVNSKINTTS